jgi:hypothetical protein
VTTRHLSLVVDVDHLDYLIQSIDSFQHDKVAMLDVV